MNLKSKSKYCLSFAAVLAASASIHAAPLIYEPFSQTGGSLNAKPGGTGLSGNWSINQTVNVLETPTLIYGALEKSGGQVEIPSNSGPWAAITTTTDLASNNLLDDGATLWFSYVFQKTANGGSNEHSGFAFGTDPVAPAFNGLNMQNSGYGLGVYTNASNVVASSWSNGSRTSGSGSANLTLSTSILVIGKIEWGASAGDNETITIWTRALDDIATEPTTGGSVRTTVGFDQTALNTISFGQRNSNGTHTYDEIRFGATYEDVTPADATPPILLATIPEDDGMANTPNLQASFDDQIVAGIGNISIVNDTDTITTVIDATDTTQVMFSGNDMMIAPNPALLEPGKSYHVLIDSGALQNAAGVAFAGISDSTTWNFTVETAPPVLVFPTIPADDSIDVAPNRTLVATFDEPIVLGVGDITITNVTTTTTFETIDVTDATQVNIQGSKLIIDPDGGFDPSFEYAVQIASGAVKDLVGNDFAGIADDTTWSFTTSGFTLDVSDPLVPAGLGNGDTFQLVFVTSTQTTADARDGTSDGIDNTLVINWEDYVNSVASDSSLSTIANLHWNAIVSVNNPNNALPGKAAKDHALVTAPVYRTDGTQIATGFSDMWSGSILAPIKWNQNGVEQNTAGGSSSGRQVWSGTNSDGTISTRPLGNPTSHIGNFHIRMGDADVTGGAWIQTADNLRRAPTATARVYALSQVITVVGDPVSPPTVVSIADDQGGGPVETNTLVTYTLTFSNDMNATTIDATDFGNAGSSSFTISTITEVSPTVFTVEVTPTTAGTLQFQINQGAVIQDVDTLALDTTMAIEDTTVITVNDPPSGSPYDTWASVNAPTGNPDDDFDGDGVNNAIEFVLGGLASTNDLDKLPAATLDAGEMTFTFVRDQDSVGAGVGVEIEVSTDLVDWSDTYIVGADTAGSTAGVTVTDNLDGTDTITLTVPQAPDDKKFARLKVIVTP